jgi:hypothetical protein
MQKREGITYMKLKATTSQDFGVFEKFARRLPYACGTHYLYIMYFDFGKGAGGR